ncbi:hypothetical protein [Streptomyces sp. CBMA123]|uniref:hypothetical protein n=1 Tax=Streptomyces sp. CBMA123 TaxID=1896313 RepID=UPI001CB8141A|nr:hypothetical protein [Streptomyces sp. CBMA123]
MVQDALDLLCFGVDPGDVLQADGVLQHRAVDGSFEDHPAVHRGVLRALAVGDEPGARPAALSEYDGYGVVLHQPTHSTKIDSLLPGLPHGAGVIQQLHGRFELVRVHGEGLHGENIRHRDG